MFVLPRQRFYAYFVNKFFFIKNMGNSESQESSEGKMEQSNTNLGLLNMSSGEVSTIGASEILEIIILVLLVWMVGKWCCKRKKRQSEMRERKLEEAIQRVEARPTAPTMLSMTPTIAPMMQVPAVTFQNPGNDRVVFMKETNDGKTTEWDRFR